MKKVLIIISIFQIAIQVGFAQTDVSRHIKEGNIQLLKSYFEQESKYQAFIKYFTFSVGDKKIVDAAKSNTFYSH